MEIKELVRNVKSACVAIGISKEKEIFPLEIHGSGFIVDSEGYVLTAAHVIDGLKKRKSELKSRNISSDICAYKIDIQDNHPVIKTRGLIERRRIDIRPSQKHHLPTNYDVVVARMTKNEKWPFLTLKKPDKLEVYDNIMICGYPGGAGSFNLSDFESGIRMSPQIQTGKISSTMPLDDVFNPTGIQTDIIGTGGTSGSPIVRVNDGEVIGIAQRVISSGVINKEKQLVGSAQIGLVFGISNYVLYTIVNHTIKQMKQELDENGYLKPEYENKYKNGIPEEFKIKFDNPEKIHPSN